MLDGSSSFAGITTAGTGIVVCSGLFILSGGLAVVTFTFSVVVAFSVLVVHQGLVVANCVVGFLVVLHQVTWELLVSGLAVEEDSHEGHVVGVVDMAPLSTPVVRVGAGGVTGSGGLVQSPPDGALSVRRPNPRFRALRSGNDSRQHLHISKKK